jgi:hypothetical protein
LLVMYSRMPWLKELSRPSIPPFVRELLFLSD